MKNETMLMIAAILLSIGGIFAGLVSDERFYAYPALAMALFLAGVCLGMELQKRKPVIASEWFPPGIAIDENVGEDE